MAELVELCSGEGCITIPGPEHSQNIFDLWRPEIVRAWKNMPGLLLTLLLVLPPVAGCSKETTPAANQSGVLTGTVRLGSSVPLWMLHGTMTVIVYMKGTTSPAYLPVAISEFYHPVFPVGFRITQKNVRLSGIDLKGNVRIVARLSLESPSPLVSSGEYTGMTPGEVPVGGPPVTLTIDHPSSR